MPPYGEKRHAIVVLPGSVSTRDATRPERRWLAKGRVTGPGERPEPLCAVLDVLGIAPVSSGLAALRKWGQSGERPSTWLCAADPVFLEARLDHLRLFALDDVRSDELAALFEALQARLATDRTFRFRALGGYGYLESNEPLATATASARSAHGEVPDGFLPQGDAAAEHDRLQSEVQMCLHELAENREREASGRAPVNALWFWGGGRAAAEPRDALPVLFADDPLATGFWLSANAQRAPWPGTVGACATAAGGRAFVAIPPATPATGGPGYLGGLRDELAGAKVTATTLLFEDGLRVELRQLDRWRFWRRGPALLRGAGPEGAGTATGRSAPAGATTLCCPPRWRDSIRCWRGYTPRAA